MFTSRCRQAGIVATVINTGEKLGEGLITGVNDTGNNVSLYHQ
jgi:hypothetical protein